MEKFFVVAVVFWIYKSYVKQKCLGAGITSSGTALLKPCCLVDETEGLSWWEEMTLQEIPYSSRVTKLSGNNKGMMVYAEERNVLQTFPALALHMLVSWYEVAQFWGLSWLQ